MNYGDDDDDEDVDDDDDDDVYLSLEHLLIQYKMEQVLNICFFSFFLGFFWFGLVHLKTRPISYDFF